MLYNVTEKAFAEQKISVRGIKQRMNHWLEREPYRFLKSTGSPYALRLNRADAKASMVFGLYPREEFLESCKPWSGDVCAIHLAQYLFSSCLIDALLSRLVNHSVVGHEVLPPVDSQSLAKKAKIALKRKKYKERVRARKIAEKHVLANSADVSEILQLTGLNDDKGSGGEEDLEVEKDPSSKVQDVVDVLLGSDAQFSIGSSFNITEQLPSSPILSKGLKAVAYAAKPRNRTPEPKRNKSRFASPPLTPQKASVSAPVRTSKGYQIAWDNGVKKEYLSILLGSVHKANLKKFDELQDIIRIEGMEGLRKLGVKKMEGSDGIFSYRLNDYLRAVFFVDDKEKKIIFLKGISH